MNTRTKGTKAFYLDRLGANALLAATIGFLRQNDIPKNLIVDFVKKSPAQNQRGRSLRIYQAFERTQEEIGIIMGTWFSNPKFLDPSGRPKSLTIGKGAHSLPRLIRASGVNVRPSVALELMRQSPSVGLSKEGNLLALKRVFVLPNLQLIRAAFVVERYFETVLNIASARKLQTPLLLERSCHVSTFDFSRAIPLLRLLESRGTAFMDLVDGDLESHRVRKPKHKAVGEVGVHLFVWTKPTKALAKTRK